jgi:hypothetical protein
MNIVENNLVYYALWYTFIDGLKSTNSVSTIPKLLIPLHEKSISNRDSLYHKYKKNILKVTVEPIECYQYNSSSQKLEIYMYNKVENGHFYATQYHENEPNKISEVLVYLTDEEYNNWKLSYNTKILTTNSPSFFCTEYISDRIHPNIYYEDGIMNAYVDDLSC